MTSLTNQVDRLTARAHAAADDIWLTRLELADMIMSECDIVRAAAQLSGPTIVQHHIDRLEALLKQVEDTRDYLCCSRHIPCEQWMAHVKMFHRGTEPCVNRAPRRTRRK